MDIRNAGYSHDGTVTGFLYLNFSKSVKFIELADLNFFLFIRVVMIQKKDLLIH